VLHFSGTIFNKEGKTPVKDVLVEIWHCNEDGVYDNTSENYVYRAALKTGKDGKYSFRTIAPVAYQAGPKLTRPAHIHMRISGKGEQDLVTQIYFKGDKHLVEDPSSNDPKSLNRILDISKNVQNEKVVRFDIVLQNAYVLDAAAFKKVEGLYELSDKSMAEFYRYGDDLFVKFNGQIMEAMEYKGNNSFEGGLGLVKAQFEFAGDGVVKVTVSYPDDDNKLVKIKGNKTLKYPS
jgi:catechol 1,2-dioxygenase